MPNEYGLEIARFTVSIPIDVLVRLDRLAAERDETRSVLIARILAGAVAAVKMSKSDRQRCADFIAAAERRRYEKRNGG